MTSRSRSDVEIMLTASQSAGSVKNGKEMESPIFDSAVPEAYATLDSAQEEHAKYNSHQVKNPEGSDAINPNQAGVDPLYKFDGVSPSEGSVSVVAVTVGGSEEVGGVVKGVAPDLPSSLQRPRRRYEARNVLYEDHQLPQDTLKHRGLHANSYKVHQEKERGRGSYITCRCKTRTLVVAFFTTLALLLATASLVLSTLLWFGVYDSNSPSSSSSSYSSPTSTPTSIPPSTSPAVCNCPTSAKVEELRAELSAVRDQFESLKNQSSLYADKRASLSAQFSLLWNNLTHLSSDLASLPTERKVSIPSFDGFTGCTVRKSGNLACNLPEVPDGAIHEPCLTETTPVEMEGWVLLSAECRKTGPNALPDGEEVAATLETLMHNGELLMRCRCSWILDYPGQTYSSAGGHTCSLIETRCPRSIAVNGTLAWSPQ